MNSALHWSRLAERGSYLGLYFTFTIYRIFGRACARLILFPITLWFFVTGSKARRASLEYLKKIYLAGALDHAPTILDSLRHFNSFTEAALDKVDAWTGRIKTSQIDFPHRNELDRLAKSGRGALFISAHLGNMELARAIGIEEGWKRINAIVYTDHALRFNSLISRLNPKSSLNVIQVSSFGPDTAIFLKEKIDAGEWLFIVGDRTPVAANGRIVEANFLGSPAFFAMGPYVLAHLMGCQVYLFFCVRDKNRFHIILEPFAERIELSRKTRTSDIKLLASRYAERLASYVLQTPYQWFNYYDFWAGGKPSNYKH
jgi:predicted LPLAT superfamily acyltransferase